MRILIVQRSLMPPGGGNAVAAWMVEALARGHTVDVLTEHTWSPADTDAFYGTSIAGRSLTMHRSAMPWRLLGRLREDRLTRLRMSALLRRARALSSQYDLLITADNYGVFDRRGLQYVHFPAPLQPQPARFGAIVELYFVLCNRVLGAPWQAATRNLTLANSRWTAEGIARLGELPHPVVVYPPVVDPGAGLAWAERDDVFLCIGRFTASKRIELAIEILSAVRAFALPQARLVIVGSPVDDAYTSRLRRIAEALPWIEFREDLSRRELNDLMGRSRYGIQSMIGEHFGMATAEMTRAGCLVFAHRSGGTPEVLNQEDALLWSTDEEAVQRIRAIAGLLGNEVAVQSLRTRLRRHAEQFSCERFVEQLNAIVDGIT
jgi:glycosyltransferase involved in cell wall biosynthesis